MSLFQNVVLSIFDGLFYILIVQTLISATLQRRVILLYSVIIGLLAGGLGHIIPSPYASMVLSIFVIGALLVIFRLGFISNLYAYTLATIILMAFQLIAIIPIALINGGDLSYTFNTGLVAQSIGLIFVIITVKWVPIWHIYYYIQKRHMSFSFLIVNAYLLVFMILIYWNLNFQGVMENIIAVTAIMFLLLAVNVILLTGSHKDLQLQKQLDMNNQYMPIIHQLIGDIRKKQHDYHNHLQALSMITATSNDLTDVRERMETYVDHITDQEVLEPLLRLNQVIVSGFLYSKIKEAESKGKKIEVSVQTTRLSTKLFDHEWIELLGVLIDNGLEAISQGESLRIILDSNEAKNVVTVMNPFEIVDDATFSKWFQIGVSTKGENRGIGLYNLKKTVSKRQGLVAYGNTKEAVNQVYFKIILPYENLVNAQ